MIVLSGKLITMDLITFDETIKYTLCHKEVEEVNEKGICPDCLDPDPCENCQSFKCSKCKVAK